MKRVKQEERHKQRDILSGNDGAPDKKRGELPRLGVASKCLVVIVACEGLIDSSGTAVGFEERREVSVKSVATAAAEPSKIIKGRKEVRPKGPVMSINEL
jgi:hypothetical protein